MQEVVRSEKFRRTLATVLKTWRSPQILADYYNIQQRERKVKAFLTLFRCALFTKRIALTGRSTCVLFTCPTGFQVGSLLIYYSVLQLVFLRVSPQTSRTCATGVAEPGSEDLVRLCPACTIYVACTLRVRNSTPLPRLTPRHPSQVMSNYLRFLRALLGASDESVHDLRFRDPANAAQMHHVPRRARQLWEVSGVNVTARGEAAPRYERRLCLTPRSRRDVPWWRSSRWCAL